jgi:hypothetical protein
MTTTFWQEQLRLAAQLTPAECYRHALVSIGNQHKCQDCFTCACATIYRQRQQTGTFWVKS